MVGSDGAMGRVPQKYFGKPPQAVTAPVTTGKGKGKGKHHGDESDESDGWSETTIISENGNLTKEELKLFGLTLPPHSFVHHQE